MRSLILALVAAVAGMFASQAWAAPPLVKKLSEVPAVAAQPVKTLAQGQQAQGTIARVNPVTKSFDLQTPQGLMRVPGGTKLQIQNGWNGSPKDATFGEVQQMAARRVIVVVIRVPGKVIIVVIVSRRVA